MKKANNKHRVLLGGTLLAAMTTPSVAFAAGGSVGTTSIFHAINLVALLALLIYFARKPMQKMLAERKAQVTSELEEARRLHEEARQMLANYESRLSGLEVEKAAILKEYKDLGQAEKERIVAEAKRQAEKITKDAEMTVQGEIQRARHALEAEVVQLATDLAEEKLRQRLDAGAQARLFDAYLADMEREIQG
jgi:F-type H+-transporting ATPase subunit b